MSSGSWADPAAETAAATLRRGGLGPRRPLRGRFPFQGRLFWGGAFLHLKGSTRKARPSPASASPPLSTGPSLKTERFRRGRSCGTEGNPVRGAPARLHRHKIFVSGGPGAGVPHGSLAGPRQPLVPFPCGKGTRCVRRRTKLPSSPPPHPPSVRRLSMIPNKYPMPSVQHPKTKSSRHFSGELLLLLQPYLWQYRTIRRQRRRCLFRHLPLGDFSIYLQ